MKDPSAAVLITMGVAAIAIGTWLFGQSKRATDERQRWLWRHQMRAVIAAGAFLVVWGLTQL